MLSKQRLRGLFLLAGVIIATDLFAQTTQVLLRWRPAPGASGYTIQIRDESEKIINEFRTDFTVVAVPLAPGTYTYRLAAIDTYSKTSEWSAWFNLVVRKTGNPLLEGTIPDPVLAGETSQPFFLFGTNLFAYTEVKITSANGRLIVPIREKIPTAKGLELRLDTSRVPAGDYNLVLENPGEKFLRRPGYVRIIEPGIAHLPWSNTVPGLPQLRRGQTAKGLAWMTLFTGLAAAGAVEFAAAESIALTKATDSSYLLFNNPTLYFGFTRGNLGSTSGEFLLAASVYQRGREQTNEHATHQRNQAIIGGAAALFYIAHWVDVIFFAPAGSAAAEPAQEIDFYFAAMPGPGGRRPAPSVDFGLILRF